MNFNIKTQINKTNFYQKNIYNFLINIYIYISHSK